MVRNTTFGKFLRDRTGNVALSFAVAMPLVIGAAGIAVDSAIWQTQRDELQKITDQAALAGAAAFDDMRYPTTTARVAGAGNGAKAVVLSARPELTPNVVVDVARKSVRVELADRGLVGFAGIFGIETVDLASASTAIADRDMGSVCLLALDETAQTGIAVAGSGRVVARDCAVWSNATSRRSITVAGTAELAASRACAAGDAATLAPDARLSGAIKTRCARLGDPLATWTPSVPSGCSKTNFRSHGSADVTLWPGTYCGGIDIGTRGSITLMPGEYHVKGGDLRLQAGGQIVGEDVGVHLSGGRGHVEIVGKSRLRLTARTAGDLKGKVLSSDRPQTSGLTARLEATAIDLVGTVYLPTHALAWTGTAAAGGSPVTQLIAGSLSLTATQQGAEFRADFDSAKVPRVSSLLPILRLAK